MDFTVQKKKKKNHAAYAEVAAAALRKAWEMASSMKGLWSARPAVLTA